MTTTIFYIILGFVTFEFVLTKILAYLNTLNWSDELPEELKGIYDEEKYKKSQQYEKTKHKFSMITSSFSFIVTFLVLVFGLFGVLDSFLRTYTENPIILALSFFGTVIILQTIINLPFSYYSTFVIEEKFGFNKSTKKIFFLDLLKSLLLSFIIGFSLLALIVFVYQKLGDNFWWMAWIIMTLFSVFFMFFYSTLIVPLFNKQIPLQDQELKKKIEDFAQKVGFKLDNIYEMDASKRSTKGNAYFSGFGSKKRIVLFDTLIKDLTHEELVAVLAHEIGHYKKKHTIQMLVFGTLETGFMLFMLSLALKIPEISYALGTTLPSFHIGLVAFSILFTPISIILGLFGNILSRKNEYQADEFAGINYDPKFLQDGLKKLSEKNLSNLRPHKAYEFFYYSHPTVLKRLKFLEKFKKLG
ncbi:MAG: M48 family metallopeptidase [Candidatus Gracilibacteria bacterium]|nr:M48 family metallopeptidase [Candidatus Gracilibacteria bacterium]